MSGSRSSAAAAALSLLFPGLGQLYAGRPLRGLLLALPAVLLMAGAGLALSGGAGGLMTALLRPGVLPGLLAAGLALFVYHAAAILDAYRVAGASALPAGEPARSPKGRGATTALLVALVTALVLHGVPWYVGIRAAPNLAAIFHEGEEPADWAIPPPSWEQSPSPAVGADATPTAEPSPSASAAQPATQQPASVAPSPAPTPSPTLDDRPEWARDGRLNIVLLGSDEGPGRWSLRPDAIFLLSVDVASARSALFGFPRYMSNIPLPPESASNYEGGKFPGYFNALYRAAQDRPRRFPGNDARGLRVMAGAMQELTGVRVDHYVMVNLNGFVQVVDAMGGLWVDVPEPGVRDAAYGVEDGSGQRRLRLEPGCQKLDGRMALFFARSRHQDSDYHRLERQQLTIAAMRRQFDPLAVLPRLPELFDAAGDNLYWTVRPEDLAPMAALASRVDADRMERVLFAPPEYERELDDEIIERIRQKVRGVFEEPESAPSPSPRDGGECPPQD